jgi:hypothetical protein
MIKTLRESEAVILYQNILKIEEEEKAKTVEFLSDQYQLETLDYPFVAPPFSGNAALWAAEVVYLTAQLILYRKHEAQELEDLFPKALFEINPSTILSVDLCFRFIPTMIEQLRLIDSEDALVPLLERALKKWHFSGVNYPLSLADNEFTTVFSTPCLEQLYLDRIVKYKTIKLANNPLINQRIQSNLGMFSKEYWSDFKTTTTTTTTTTVNE